MPKATEGGASNAQLCSVCGAQVAPGAPRCPECPSTEFLPPEPDLHGFGDENPEDDVPPGTPEDVPELPAAPPRVPPRRDA